MANAEIQRQVATETPLILRVGFPRRLAKVCRVVKTRLLEGDIISQQEISKVLEIRPSSCVGFLGGGVRRQDAGLDDATGDGVEKSGKQTLVESGECILVLSVVREGAPKFHGVIAVGPGDVTAKIMLIGKVIVVSESHQ